MGFMDTAVEYRGKIPYAAYAEKLSEAVSRTGEFSYIFDSLAKLCSVMDIKYDLSLRTRKAYKAGDKKTLATIVAEFAELEKRLVVFHDAFYLLWHKENKPQGWEVQDARIGGLMQRVATCRKRLQAYLAGELAKIEELEEEILPHGNGQNLQHNLYCGAISMSPM
jgi:hypothetical protein